MNNNYQIAYNQEWKKLKKLEWTDLERRLDVKYDTDKNIITIPYFKENYVLDFNNETIYRQSDGITPNIGDSIIILNYLTHSTDYIINTKKWISLKEIQGGGSLFYPAFYKSSIEKVLKAFGKDIKGFQKNAQNLGGREIKFGHAAYEFEVLPKINICIALWEGDEEISPNATVLFEPSIQHLVHIETVIGIGMCVVDKVVQIGNTK